MLLVCIFCVINCILLYNVKIKYNVNRIVEIIVRKIEVLYMLD